MGFVSLVASSRRVLCRPLPWIWLRPGRGRTAIISALVPLPLFCHALGFLLFGFFSCSLAKFFARVDDPAPCSLLGIVDVCGAHGLGQVEIREAVAKVPGGSRMPAGGDAKGRPDVPDTERVTEA